MLLREQSIFSFDEVLHAVFETNGELSVLKNHPARTATKRMFMLLRPHLNIYD